MKATPNAMAPMGLSMSLFKVHGQELYWYL